jgi:hypothetical protein
VSDNFVSINSTKANFAASGYVHVPTLDGQAVALES